MRNRGRRSPFSTEVNMRNRGHEIRLAPPDYKRLFEHAPGLYMVLDPELRVVAASDAYLEATLTSRETIIGRHVFDIFPDNPDDPSADSVRNSTASFNRVLKTRMPDTIGLQRHDVRRPESEGGGFEERYWSAINYPILNADGSLAYIMHRVENVTEFVQLKQQGVEQGQLTDALREQAVKMEADLYARSREMAETSQRLKEANEELARLYEKTKELEAVKSDFFANVSHELRTPLTLILGPVQKLLQSAEISSDNRRDLAIVQRNARLLLKNVNDLLDLSKLDAGGFQPEYVRVDLVSLTRFVASHFETVAADREISFALDTPAALPAEADAPKLQRVLFNLISNAFKFTPAGGVVRLRLREEGGKAVYVVDDTGPGIPPEMRETIFERFRQVESGPTRKHGGTGLGLSIAKEFVTLHGGTIEVTGAAEGGASFIVKLPLSAPAGTAVKATGTVSDGEGSYLTVAELFAPQVPAVGRQDSLPPGAPLVLVVEDNAEMNAFLREILGRSHHVASAPDGAEGLEQALRLSPDLIVTDLMMPRMSGDEMIHQIRQHRELDDVPILLLTAKADEELRVKLLSSGAQDSLPKPFLAEELVARAEGLISRKRRVEESLRESEERFRTLADNIAQLAWMSDRDGAIFWYNKRWYDYTGTTPEEMQGFGWRKVCHPDHLQRVMERISQSLRTGEVWDDTFPLRGRDGQYRWFLSRAVPIRNERGEVIRWFGTNTDITDQKRAEEELRDARDHLEVRVRERTEELRRALDSLEVEARERVQAVEELRAREQMLMQQNRLAAMGEMLFNISHQWRQPLNLLAAGIQRLGIMYQHGGFTEELLNGTIDDSIEIIQKMSQTIGEFQELLAPSREKELFSVEDVIGKTVALVGESYQSQGIVIESRGSGGGQVYGNPRDYGQVLMNLLSNARDALLERRETGRRIIIDAGEENERSVVTVTDNAGGIDEKVSDKIFDAYFTTKALGKGAGVGLFLSKMIVEQNMGGRLSFRNVEDGAQFRIEI